VAAAVDGQRVAYVCRSHAQARATFGLVKVAALKTDAVEKCWSGYGDQRIRFTTGGEIKFLAGLNIRGHSADVEIIDEAIPESLGDPLPGTPTVYRGAVV
jgi:hypothetical protein